MAMFRDIAHELKHHTPFTFIGVVTGAALMLVFVYAPLPRRLSYNLFWSLHPLHVLLSAVATTAMYRKHGGRNLLATLLIGYLGSVGIATVSDSLIPYVGEVLLKLPEKDVHVGFIEKWWLVNPLALAGIGIAMLRPNTEVPHTGHVLLSTWASLFHMVMAMQHGQPPDVVTLVLVPVFLFVAVWVPCCTSDIVFPLLFARQKPPHPDH